MVQPNYPTYAAGGDPTNTLKGVSVIGLLRPLFPPRVSGRTYALNNTPVVTQPFNAIDTIYFTPFFMPDTLNVNNGKMRITTGGAGSSVKAGIWASSPISGVPVGPPLGADNVGVASTSNGVDIILGLGQFTLTPGWYWYGSKTTGTPPTTQALQGGHCLYSYLYGLTGSLAVSGLTLADAYANNIPTIPEGTGSLNISGANHPIVFLTAA